MDLNKIPRWALVLVASFGLLACGTLVSTARADLDKFKTIAYQAKNASDQNTEDIAELKAEFKSYRSEYREDQKDMQKTLADISRAVKA